MMESANQQPRRARRWLALWPLALALALAGIWVWQNAAQKRALESQKRVEMYERTLENVRSVFAQPKPELQSYCRDQATILLEFPECDPVCVALARRVRGEPTR